MDNIPLISSANIDAHLDWAEAAQAIRDGHGFAKGVREDLYLSQGARGYFNRCAWIEGLGLATKSVTVFADNRHRLPPLPAIQGAVLLFDDDSGQLQAVIDGELITKWKTTADSLLGAQLLAPQNPQHLLILGAGVVARHHTTAFHENYPSLETITIWNRTAANAKKLAAQFAHLDCNVQAITDLPAAAGQADIISCVTMSDTPVLQGEWVSPDTHVDLVGAFLPHMREADDALLLKANIYVDSFESNIEDIGELAIPLHMQTITMTDIRADLYELCDSTRIFERTSKTITVFKNGGGGHLDLMCARYIFEKYNNLSD